MEYATFRKWLAERGCRFDTQSEKRGEGYGTVTIHRAGRTAELPLVGASHNLDPLRFAKSAKHSASIGPNFSVRRAVSEATSVGGLYHYFENAGAMSAFGPKRTFKKRHTMSAFWGKADIGIVEHNDRLWLLSGLSPAIPGKSMSSRPR